MLFVPLQMDNCPFKVLQEASDPCGPHQKRTQTVSTHIVASPAPAALEDDVNDGDADGRGLGRIN